MRVEDLISKIFEGKGQRKSKYNRQEMTTSYRHVMTLGCRQAELKRTAENRMMERNDQIASHRSF